MIYICFKVTSKTFKVATNIRSLSEVTGIRYSKIYRMIKNGEDPIEFGEFIICKIRSEDILKGKQRISKTEDHGKS